MSGFIHAASVPRMCPPSTESMPLSKFGTSGNCGWIDSACRFAITKESTGSSWNEQCRISRSNRAAEFSCSSCVH